MLKEMDTRSRETTRSNVFTPFGKESALKRQNMLSLGANVSLLKKTLGAQENKNGCFLYGN